jgi:hypothetical protein
VEHAKREDVSWWTMLRLKTTSGKVHRIVLIITVVELTKIIKWGSWVVVQKLLEDMDGKYLDKKESMCKNSRV